MVDRKHTTTDLIPFHFHTTLVSAVTDDNGEPWFIAADVCAALGVSNASKAVSRLDPDEKNTITLSDSNRGNPEMLIISESGLYDLALSSRKPIGKEFKRWVKKEVLPSIRKTGQYTIEDPVDRYPQLRAIRELVTATATAQLTAERAEEQAKAAQEQAQVAQDQAQRAEKKAAEAEEIAREAVSATGRVTIEAFILGNKLLPQFPGRLDAKGRRSWPVEVARLKAYCQAHGWPILPVEVHGKNWPEENGYPIQALSWLMRHPTGATQLGLVKGRTL
jgi:prophage antirepressor-like protein